MPWLEWPGFACDGKNEMTEKLRIDLQILLPHVPDEADACIGRLIDDLQGRNGIEQVHLKAGSDGAPAQMCIHYDQDALPLARIREVVESAGARISERYGHALWNVTGIQHQRRIGRFGKARPADHAAGLIGRGAGWDAHGG